MKISVIIVCHNDTDLLSDVIVNLLETADDRDFEIVVVNDGSISDDGKFMPISSFYGAKVVNIPSQRGVGFAFDRGVSACEGEIIVLMGSDVFTDNGWLGKVRESIGSMKDTIACTTCVGVSPTTRDIHSVKARHYYGADLLIQMGFEDLPLARQKEFLNARVPKTTYTDLFRAKWRTTKDSDEPYELPCLLGAFYWITKEFYSKIGGFDTENGKRFQGHLWYGHLEPYISLKTYLMGGSLVIHPDIKTGHCFGRLTKQNRGQHRAFRQDYTWFNALFILHTMCDDDIIKHLLGWVDPVLPFNKAKTYIKRNYDNVLYIKNKNKERFIYDLGWYMNKFNYKLK